MHAITVDQTPHKLRSRCISFAAQYIACGIDPETDARERISVRFYIIAILFVIFDVETIFLFPWAVTYDQLLLFGLIEMFIFLGILIVGYFYVWKTGALEWT